MVRPRHLDGVIGTDASTTGVAARAKPMILRCTGGACTPSVVGSSVHSATKDMVGEDGIVRDYSGCEVMRDALTDFENSVDLRITILGYDLERSEQFSREKLSLPLSTEVLQWHVNGGRLPGSVAIRDRVALERGSTEKNFSAVEL